MTHTPLQENCCTPAIQSSRSDTITVTTPEKAILTAMRYVMLHWMKPESKIQNIKHDMTSIQQNHNIYKNVQFVRDDIQVMVTYLFHV